MYRSSVIGNVFLRHFLSMFTLVQFLMSSGRVFHNFTPYTERHIAFMLVRTWTITTYLFWRVECTLEYLVNLLCNWIGKVPWNKLNIIMAVLYFTNSESFNIDISLNIALVWANLLALQISLMAFFCRVNKHFKFDGYVLPQISLQ